MSNRKPNISDMLSKETLEYILDFLPDAMFAIDKEGRVIQWNRALEEMTGVKAEDILGKGDYEVALPFYGQKRKVLAHYAMEIDEKDIEKNYSLIKREGNVLIAEVYVPFPGYRKEGAWLWGRAAPLYDKDKNIIGAVEIVRDITERKKMEEERLALERRIVESEKNKSIEILSAGVAHDFNNILMAILGYADLIQVSMNNEETVKKSINEIKKAVLRGSELSQQMLRFAGKTKILFENIKINNIVNDIIDLLKVSISRKINLIFSSGSNEIMVKGDPTQLRQIVLNLVLNAAEAIGDKSGTINIDIDCMYLEKTFINSKLSGFELEEGKYIKLTIEDTGCGMDEYTLKHLFEPFFTTKFTGRGLGMAEVLGIIKAHKGAIMVSSSPNKGSVFDIYLPAVSSETTLESLDYNDRKMLNRFSGTAMIADDEEAIRISVSSMLKRLGFEVFISSNGEDALRMYRNLYNKPDIIFLDILMPEMDGVELLNEIRKINPSQKIIFISGYTGNKINLAGLNERITSFLRKPFDIYMLSETISLLLKDEE